MIAPVQRRGPEQLPETQEEERRERLKELDRRVRAWVRERPLLTIGCAAAAGYLTARLVSRLRDA
ncbi:MAG: hypothetical protein AB7N76_09900 [Planctomycetota bacterium]